jgi:4-amino-4-deoxy-L-arabinose transferase-like glycosyltransferase
MDNWIRGHQKLLWHLACVVLLLIFCLQTCAALRVESATVDETISFTRGYLYLAHGDLHFKHGHPILGMAINALPVWALIELNVPFDDPTWDTSWSVWSDRFLWNSGNPVLSIFTLSRLAVIVLGILTAGLIARWGRELFGPVGGLVALILYIFDPNILAHGHLVTNDIAVTGFSLAAVYGLWRFYKTRRYSSLILSGVMLGCAQVTKYSALVLLPLFGLLIILGALCDRHRLRTVAANLALMLAVAGIAAWAAYGFQVGALTEIELPLPVPAPDYFDNLIWQIRYMGREHGAYLMGETSTAGWWYYDLIALVIKTPLPLLILVLVASVRSLGRREWRLELLLPVAAFVAATCYSRVDIGLRYLLPIYPFLHIYAARIAIPPRRQSAQRPWVLAVSLVIAWLVVGTVSIAPHYLAYFNELIGGPDNGPHYLVDSNLDWGQALPSLRRWMREHNVDSVYLSYFGTAHPSAYDIAFTALPTWEAAPEKGNPFQRVFVPSDPAPGVYAISATNLFGPTVPDRETLAWFRDRDPVARVGHAIYVYRVERTGPPVNVTLSGLQIDELTPEAIAQFGTNDLRLRWFDARHGIVFPSGGESWYAVAEETPLDPGLADRFWRHAKASGQGLYRLSRPDDISTLARKLSVWWSPTTAFPAEGFERYALPWPINFGRLVELLGYEVIPTEAWPGDEMTLLTYWRVQRGTDRPLKIFAHLLDESSQVKVGQDRLDMAAAGWREGDVFIQLHRLSLPEDVAGGRYQLEIGWYDGQTTERLSVYVEGDAVADRVLLEPIVVSPR